MRSDCYVNIEVFLITTSRLLFVAIKGVYLRYYIATKGNDKIMRTNKKNLSTDEINLLKLIDDKELQIFDVNEIKRFTIEDVAYLQGMLSMLVNKQFLFRIENTKFCTRNFRNPNVIGNFLIEQGSIAYWTALNLHRLTEQIPNVVYVQSPFRKNDKKVFNVRYKFIKVKAEKVCGIMEMGYGNEMFRITDVEKTLLDCFDLPKYSGGYEELIRAFYKAKASSVKLLSYGKQMNNLSVLKRLAFLSELFEMNGFTVFQAEVLKIVNSRYSLLDPFGENEGEFNNKWRIRVNIPKEKLLGIINKMY